MSIRDALVLDDKADLKSSSANLSNVSPACLSLQTSTMPSTMVAKGLWTQSTLVEPFSNSCINVALLVFINSPARVARDQRAGPSG